MAFPSAHIKTPASSLSLLAAFHQMTLRLWERGNKMKEKPPAAPHTRRTVQKQAREQRSPFCSSLESSRK